jgi:hypothetical protein
VPPSAALRQSKSTNAEDADASCVILSEALPTVRFVASVSSATDPVPCVNVMPVVAEKSVINVGARSTYGIPTPFYRYDAETFTSAVVVIAM